MRDIVELIADWFIALAMAGGIAAGVYAVTGSLFFSLLAVAALITVGRRD